MKEIHAYLIDGPRLVDLTIQPALRKEWEASGENLAAFKPQGWNSAQIAKILAMEPLGDLYGRAALEVTSEMFWAHKRLRLRLIVKCAIAEVVQGLFTTSRAEARFTGFSENGRELERSRRVASTLARYRSSLP